MTKTKGRFNCALLLPTVIAIQLIAFDSSAQSNPRFVLTAIKGSSKTYFKPTHRVVIKTSTKKMKGYIKAFSPDSIYISSQRHTLTDARRISCKDILYIRRIYGRARAVVFLTFFGGLIMTAVNVTPTGSRDTDTRDAFVAGGLTIAFLSVLSFPITFLAESSTTRETVAGWDFSIEKNVTAK